MVIKDRIKPKINICKFKQNKGIFIINKTNLILIYKIKIHKMHQKISLNLKVIRNKRNLKKTGMVLLIKTNNNYKRILKSSISWKTLKRENIKILKKIITKINKKAIFLFKEMKIKLIKGKWRQMLLILLKILLDWLKDKFTMTMNLNI